MPDNNNEVLPQNYEKLAELLREVKQEADVSTRLALIEQQYLKREIIDKMIWDRINTNEANKTKNSINWSAVIQGVIIAVLSAG